MADAPVGSPNPTLELDAAGIVEDVPAPWQLGVGLQFTFPVSGRLSAETERGEAAHRSAVLAVAVDERETVARVREAWIEWSVAARRVDLLTAHRERLVAIERVAKRLSEAGELDPADSGLIAVSVAALDTRTVGLRSDASLRRAHVLALLGLVADAPVTLVTTLPENVPVAPTDKQLAKHPKALAALAVFDEAEAGLALVVAGRNPDVSVGPKVEHDAGRWAVGASASIPLPFLDRSERRIAEARGNSDLARAAVATALQGLREQRFMATTMLAGASDLRRSVVEILSPVLKAQLARSQTLIEAGEVQVLLLERLLEESLVGEETLLNADRQAALAHALLLSLQPEVSP